MRYIILLAVMLFTLRSISQVSEKIKINQVGYLPCFNKIAVYTGEDKKDEFIITNAKTGETIFKGKLSEPRRSAYSSLNAQIADFSSLNKAGKYILTISGVGSSFPFEISDQIYKTAGISVLKAFYYIRSDVPLDRQFAEKWSRPAGHPDTAVILHPSAADVHRQAGSKISTPGGWYDAGDYNKYIVNSGITMATLLSAYEDFPEYFNKLKTNIPESKDLVPDLINEILYNLRWMLTMQDPSDGGVYHKCTNAAFDGMVMPGVTKLPRYVVQKSTAATLDFAAVMAKMGRIARQLQFEKRLPGLADSCTKAAIKAWNWATSYKDSIYDQRKINQAWKPAVTTGEYGDRNLTDEWFWAAAELLITTRNKQYYDTVLNKMRLPGSIPSWNNVAMLGYYSLASQAYGLPDFAYNLKKSATDTILRLADQLISGMNKSAFRTVMGQSQNDFIWGSNSVAANQGVLLGKAWKLSGKEIYLEGSISNLDYMLGRNALNLCFITGLGYKSPLHPHHRPSVADQIDEPVPGLLVGGPNPGQQDKEPYPTKEPELSYIDNDKAYACNEIAINWNAPAVYLINAVQAASNTCKNKK